MTTAAPAVYDKSKRNGLEIFLWLRRRGHTLAGIGRTLGVSRNAVHRVVHGYASSERVLNHLLDLGVPLKWLGGKR